MTWREIPGWMAPEFERFYETVAETYGSDARIVEVGCAYGRSIAFLVEQFIARGKAPPTIYAVDVWEEFMGGDQADKAEFVACMMRNHRDPLEAFHAQLREFSPAAYRSVVTMPGWSHERANAFDDGSLDVVMIDARHEFASVKSDLYAWIPRVRDGGVIAGDDYDKEMFPGLVAAVDEFACDFEMYLEISGRVWSFEVRE